MAVEQEFLVLKEYRPYQRILEAFNSENFHGKNPKEIVINILYALCFTAIFVAMAALAILSCWYCMEIEFNIGILSITLPIVLSLVQLLLIHSSLIWKNRLIRTTIDHLQEMIDRRKLEMND